MDVSANVFFIMHSASLDVCVSVYLYVLCVGVCVWHRCMCVWSLGEVAVWQSAFDIGRQNGSQISWHGNWVFLTLSYAAPEAAITACVCIIVSCVCAWCVCVCACACVHMCTICLDQHFTPGTPPQPKYIAFANNFTSAVMTVMYVYVYVHTYIHTYYKPLCAISACSLPLAVCFIMCVLSWHFTVLLVPAGIFRSAPLSNFPADCLLSACLCSPLLSPSISALLYETICLNHLHLVTMTSI